MSSRRLHPFTQMTQRADHVLFHHVSGQPQALGNLQAFWILGFVATQFPVGLALDTIGPRRTVACVVLFC